MSRKLFQESGIKGAGKADTPARPETDDKQNDAIRRGKILRIKHGYNPNSSSIGSIIFALPSVLLGVTAGFGLASALIMAKFLDRNPENKKGTAESQNDRTGIKQDETED